MRGTFRARLHRLFRRGLATSSASACFSLELPALPSAAAAAAELTEDVVIFFLFFFAR